MKKYILIFLLVFPNFLKAQDTSSLKPQIFIFLYEDCPISIYMTPYIKKIAQTFDERIELNLIYPNALSNYKTIMEFQNKYGIPSGNIILDEEQKYTKKLGASITPEAFVLIKDKIIYQGRINNGYASIGKRRTKPSIHDLENAIIYALGKDVTPIKECPPAIGCYITQR
jgi:hypothetical protein